MKEALKLALEALEHWDNWSDHTPPKTIEAMTAIKEALAQPAQEPDHGDELTIAYMSGVHRGKELAAQGEERNFCPRCGKRTADLTVIHTCTPPQENT